MIGYFFDSVNSFFTPPYRSGLPGVLREPGAWLSPSAMKYHRKTQIHSFPIKSTPQKGTGQALSPIFKLPIKAYFVFVCIVAEQLSPAVL